ncbi:hypothetical protein [Sinorhizobium fredii]|nr:hypothetical protein [Sinorhizobium fredii]
MESRDREEISHCDIEPRALLRREEFADCTKATDVLAEVTHFDKKRRQASDVYRS